MQQVEWNLQVAEPQRLMVAAAPGEWTEVRDKGLAEGKEIEWIRLEGKVQRFALRAQLSGPAKP